MQADRSATAAPAEAVQGIRNITTGEVLYGTGDQGLAWRIRRGAVRLDRTSGEMRSFAGLALTGDVIGAETLIFGHYSFEARALGDTELEPWPPSGTPSAESLLRTLAAAERRAADALALRAGEALSRVRQLVLLLAGERPTLPVTRIAVPRLRDMAEITGLTIETVSRTLGLLQKAGVLQKQGSRGGGVRTGLTQMSVT